MSQYDGDELQYADRFAEKWYQGLDLEMSSLQEQFRGVEDFYSFNEHNLSCILRSKAQLSGQEG